MKGRYFLGSAWALIALLLTILLVRGMMRDDNVEAFGFFDRMGEIFFTNDMEEVDMIFSPKEINTANIELISMSVEVQKSDDGDFHVEFYGGAEKRCKAYEKDGALYIKEEDTQFRLNFRPQKIRLLSPQNALQSIKANCTSGVIFISGLTLQEAEVAAVSGSVKISDCSIERILAETVSGEILMNGSFCGIGAESVSGKISLECSVPLTEKSTFNSTSGSVFLKIPHDSDYTLNYESVSGSFKDKITGVSGKKDGSTKNGSGTVPITITTTSGSIRIEPL